METQRDHQAITVEDEQESGTESLSLDQIQETIEKPVFISIKRLLDESKSEDNMTPGPDRSNSSRNSVCIYRVPPSLRNLEDISKFFWPWDLLTDYLWTNPYRPQSFRSSIRSDLVNSLLNQTLEGMEAVLPRLTHAMKKLETKVRDCYSELPIELLSDHLVEMLVLDGCSVVELLRQVCIEEDLGQGNQSLKRPEVIKGLTRDLLKLENQLPFFVLEKIFEICIKKGDKSDPLRLAALKLLSRFRFLPKSDHESESLKRAVLDPKFKVEHLLHLFHHSCTSPILNPQNYDQRQPMIRRFSRWNSVAFRYIFKLFWRVKASPKTVTPTQHVYHPLSNQSMQCATRLRRAGINLRPRKRPDSLLQIKFHNGVLEIPPINVDEIMVVLWNCVAWEQCHPDTCRYFSAYVDFMSYLIKSDKDATFLREEGIIRGVAYQDKEIFDIFKTLGDKVSYEDTDRYLSEQVNEMEAYCRSDWATLRRTYFSSPWTFISVAAATIVLVLTGIQTIMAILAYVKPPS